MRSLMDRAAAIELVRGLVAIPSLSRHEARGIGVAGRADARRRLRSRVRRRRRQRRRRARRSVRSAHDRPARPHRHRPRQHSRPHRADADGDAALRPRQRRRQGPARDVRRRRGARFGSAAAQSGRRPRRRGRRRRRRSGDEQGRALHRRRASTAHASRFPTACIIGEPSHWHRVTLGYKGRLLLDLTADQPMAHTAGPDASVAVGRRRLLELGHRPCRARQRRQGQGLRSAEPEPAPIHHRRPTSRCTTPSTRSSRGGCRSASTPTQLVRSCSRGRPTTSTRRGAVPVPALGHGLRATAPDHHRGPAHDLRVRVSRMGAAVARRSTERAGAQLSRRHPWQSSRPRSRASSSRPAPAT